MTHVEVDGQKSRLTNYVFFWCMDKPLDAAHTHGHMMIDDDGGRYLIDPPTCLLSWLQSPLHTHTIQSRATRLPLSPLSAGLLSAFPFPPHTVGP